MTTGSYELSQAGGQALTIWTTTGVPIPTATTAVTLGLAWDLSTHPYGQITTSLALGLTATTAAPAVLTFYCPFQRLRLTAWGSGGDLPQRQILTMVGSLSLEAGAVTGTCALEVGPLGSLLTREQGAENGQWAGTLLLAITTTASIDITALTLDSIYQPHFTGLEGPVRAQGRADFCPICGTPSTRDTWLRDGYGGRMRCLACYDPADEHGKVRPRPEQPGAGED